MIDEKLTNIIRALTALILGLVFIPLILFRVIPEANRVVTIPTDILYVFEFSVVFFFLVFVYKLWKGLS